MIHTVFSAYEAVAHTHRAHNYLTQNALTSTRFIVVEEYNNMQIGLCFENEIQKITIRIGNR